MNEIDNAARSADNLLELLIKHQPDLIKALGPSLENGEAVGDFIAGLRSRLIDMYNLNPRG